MKAQYDDKAKRLLSNKIILVHILKKTVDGFRGMNPKDVVSYFSMELTVAKKLGIIENEYSIPVDGKIREKVSEMCNLSQGIIERTEERKDVKIILNMHKKGYTSEQIAEIVEKSCFGFLTSRTLEQRTHCLYFLTRQ